MTAITNNILSILTIIANILSVLVIVILIAKKPAAWLKAIKHYALPATFLIALIATLGSLTYSEIIGYEPCKLCWLQRIFFYPQLILIGLAWLKKDYKIFDYIITLSLIGALFASYHYLLQIGAAPSIPCSALGYSQSCSQNFVLRYGYITIPMMALSGFILNFLISLIARRKSTKLLP